jgi:hypothetical protein
MKTVIFKKIIPSEVLHLRKIENPVAKDVVIIVPPNDKEMANGFLYHFDMTFKQILFAVLRVLALVLFIVINTAKGLLAATELLLRSIESNLN